MDIKDIISRINKLNNKEKLHILNILKTNNVDYSQNSNGYFFNMIKIEEHIFDKICKCLNLIEKNRDLIKEMDKRREELLIFYKKIIEKKLQDSIEFRKSQYTQKLILKDFKTNICLHKKRIMKIKYKDYLNSGLLDAEVVVKEYFKARNTFAKDTVYHRLSSRMKAFKSNKYVDTSKNDNADGEEISSGGIVDEDINIDIEIDDVDVAINEYNETDLHSELSDLDNQSIVSEEITEISLETENKKLKQIEETQTDLNLIFYRNLLNKQGFEFDDDKRCMIVYQDYIV